MKAMKSLPEGMVVKESSINGAGLGVFATEEFLSGATFGPYDGEKVRADVPKAGLDTGYMWEVSDVHINMFQYHVFQFKGGPAVRALFPSILHHLQKVTT